MAHLDLASLKRFYKRDYPLLMFYLELPPGSTATSTLPREEIQVRASELSEDMTTEGNPTVAEQWLPTPLGWSGVLYGMRNLEDALSWLERMFDETALDEAVVRGGPDTRPRRGMYNVMPTLTAHVALKTRQTKWDPIWLHHAERRWTADPLLTQAITEHLISWCHLRGGKDTLLRGGLGYTALDWKGAGPGVADAVEHGNVVMSSRLSDPIRHKVVTFDPLGLVGMQHTDPALRWQDVLSDLLSTIQRLTPHCDYAFIATQRGGISSIAALADGDGSIVPSPNHVRHLFNEFVPAPFGLQVVTSAHLAKAHNLDNWDIEDLGADRFVLAARSPELWFSPRPDDASKRPTIASRDTLASAREDFGDMLLTDQVIQERPAPRHP